MKFKLIICLAISSLFIACAESDNLPKSEQPPAGGGGGGGGGTGGGGKAFDGVLERFQAEYVSPLSGRLRPGEYLAYRFEIWTNSLPKGTIQLFQCTDASCSLRAVKYKMECNFDLLTCRLVDGNGQDVRKGGIYKASSQEVGEIEVEGNCSRFTGGRFKTCAFITLVDPQLKQKGFNAQFLGADFVPNSGPRSEFKRFHLIQ